MKRPLFSCVIPVKGARPYFDEALESLLSQGLGDDLEIIVQDGDEIGVEGSGRGRDCFSRKGRKDRKGNGKGEEGGGSPQDRRGQDWEIVVEEIRWFREADLGQSDALNKGFKKARGEWLFWLNADDVLLPGALGTVRDFINRVERVGTCRGGMFGGCGERVNCVEWIAGDMVLIDGEGKVIRCQKDRGSFRAYEGKPIRVFGPSSFFRRELFERVGGLDVNLRYCMDTDLWCRFREAGAWFKKTGSYVWGFREHDGSTTTGAKKPGEQSRQDREVAAMHEHRGVKMTAGGVRALRLRRLLDGSFIKAIFDTIRFKDKKWSEIK